MTTSHDPAPVSGRDIGIEGKARSAITIVAPVPPPYAGPEITTQHLLNSPLSEEFRLLHVRSNLKDSNADKGSFSVRALLRQLRIYWRIVQTRRAGARALYVLLAVNVLGFLKDAGTIWLGKVLGMRTVAHMKGATLPAFYRNSSRPMRWIIRRTVLRLDALMVQTRPVRDEIQHTFGLSEDVLPIVPNMVELPPPCPPGGEALTVFFMGHLSIGKGFYDLIAAMEEVMVCHPSTRFQCAGEPKQPERDYVARWMGLPDVSATERARLRSLMSGAQPGMEYLGLVTGHTKHEVLCQAGIFVLPSYSESFPMSLLEAMSYGCAVIATPVGAVPEMISHEQEGLLIEPGDRSALANAIARLLEDRELRERLGQAARGRVARQFVIDKVTPRYAEVFRRLLHPNGEG